MNVSARTPTQASTRIRPADNLVRAVVAELI